MTETEPTVWSLGDDSDCESCGWSWNELEFSIEDEYNEWNAQARVGCYGGEQIDRYSTEEDRADFYQFLNTFPGWGEAEMAELLRLIAEAETKEGTR